MESETFSDSNDYAYSRDERQLLAIFPEEIWILISKRIYIPNDLESFANSSLYFRNLVLQKRTLFLFPKVWKILGVRYHQNQKLLVEVASRVPEPPPVVPRIRCETCRRSRHPQWYSDILKCRFICRIWYNAIDNFYGDLPDALVEQTMFEKTCKWLKNQFLSRTPEEMGAFLQHFRNTHIANEDGKCERNPLVGRRLEMDFDYGRDNEFMSLGKNILQIYGHTIWNSEISTNPGAQSWIEWYTFLRQILQSMPNLKNVTLADYPFNPDQSNVELISPEERELLNGEISLNPLPVLEGLQSLKMKNFLAPVFREMILRNNHVTSLEIAQSDEDLIDLENDLFNSSLPNLKKLGIEICTVAVFSRLENVEIRFQLEELSIGLKYILNLEWSRVFRLLENKFGDKLKTLRLKLPVQRDPDFKEDVPPTPGEDEVILPESLIPGLKLPRVTHLSLEMQKLSCLDFILPMKDSLELLEVKTEFFGTDKKNNTYFMTKYQEQQIKFVGWTEKLYDSNIWSIFPKLRRINIFTSDITRLWATWTKGAWEKENKIKTG